MKRQRQNRDETLRHTVRMRQIECEEMERETAKSTPIPMFPLTRD